MRPVRALVRWTLVCAISAGPSFCWGCGLHSDPPQILAMLSGIGVFILAYTALECSRVYRHLIRQPYVRRTVWIGYGTRLAISLAFPVGMTLDVFTGLLSVGLVERGFSSAVPLADEGPLPTSFLAVFLTTLLQGTFLNMILVTYMLVVFAAQSAWGTFRVSTSRRPATAGK